MATKTWRLTYVCNEVGGRAGNQEKVITTGPVVCDVDNSRGLSVSTLSESNVSKQASSTGVQAWYTYCPVYHAGAEQALKSL